MPKQLTRVHMTITKKLAHRKIIHNSNAFMRTKSINLTKINTSIQVKQVAINFSKGGKNMIINEKER